MFYTEKKLEDNQICLRREIIKMLLAALPFLAVCVVGFAALQSDRLHDRVGSGLCGGDFCRRSVCRACRAIREIFARSIQRVDAEDGGYAGARPAKTIFTKTA